MYIKHMLHIFLVPISPYVSIVLHTVALYIYFYISKLTSFTRRNVA